mgnify:CR=1 FL=1|jgi:hypothetical protein
MENNNVLFLESNEFHEIVIDDHLVPYLKAYRTGVDEWSLSLDNRFVVSNCSKEELKKWVWFIANAMAIAAGYTSFGKNSKPYNRFGN